jgi:polyisoprenoid-binding protein YceI
MIKKYKLWIIGLLMVSFGITAFSNKALYRLSSNPELKISGTSTLHDWEMVSNSAQGDAVIVVNDNNKLEKIESLRISMRAESLKSGKTQMDNNAYKALRTKEHEIITFELKDIQNINANKFKAIGTFEIAGEKRKLIIDTEYKVVSNTIQFTGKTAFKLSDFNIDPPTAMLGTIKTGDDVTLSFDTIFSL